MRKDIQARKQEILDWILENKSNAFICQQFKCKPETLKAWLIKMNINYKGNQGLKGIRTDPKRKSALAYSQKDHVISYKLKQKLIEDGIKECKCEYCNLSEWMGSKIPLELHHLDNNHFNNDFTNLVIICSNCHSLIHKPALVA